MRSPLRLRVLLFPLGGYSLIGQTVSQNDLATRKKIQKESSHLVRVSKKKLRAIRSLKILTRFSDPPTKGFSTYYTPYVSQDLKLSKLPQSAQSGQSEEYKKVAPGILFLKPPRVIITLITREIAPEYLPPSDVLHFLQVKRSLEAIGFSITALNSNEFFR